MHHCPFDAKDAAAKIDRQDWCTSGAAKNPTKVVKTYSYYAEQSCVICIKVLDHQSQIYQL